MSRARLAICEADAVRRGGGCPDGARIRAQALETEHALFLFTGGAAVAYLSSVDARCVACAARGAEVSAPTASAAAALQECRDVLRVLATLPQGGGLDELRREFVRLAQRLVVREDGVAEAARLLRSRLEPHVASACAYYGTDLCGLMRADAAPLGFLHRETALYERSLPVYVPNLDARVRTAIEDGWEMDDDRRDKLARFLETGSTHDKIVLLSQIDYGFRRRYPHLLAQPPI